MSEKDLRYRVYLEEIAALFAKGLSPEAVSIKCDIDESFVHKCLGDPKFEEIFREIDPKAHSAWKVAQKEQVSRKRLKAQINEDAPEFYSIVAQLVRNENSSLTDKERCDYALKLASLSDAARKETEVEHVVLSEHQLRVFQEAWSETETVH